MKISRKLAIQILKYCHENSNFYFPFQVVCKEYTPEDNDFVEIDPEEWEMILEDDIYQTFELWENLKNLHEETVRLMSKGFLEKITGKQELLRNFIFYTTEGLTFEPNTDGDFCVENCQILGWAKGYNPRDALLNLKIESPWLENSKFEEIIASELKDEKTYYFNLK